MEQSSARSHERFSSALQQKIARTIFSLVQGAPSGIVSVGFISDAQMKKLNSTYRKKHKTTDVLSFGYDSPLLGEGKGGSDSYIGDVVISLPQARRQAKKGVRRECVDLLVHGILHVMGYDHERPADAKRMLPLQADIVSRVL